MNHFYRVVTFLLCFMVFNSWAETPQLIETELFTTCADRAASNTIRCMNDDYQNTKYGGYILLRGLENHYKLENGRFQEFLDGTAQLTGRWVNIEKSDVKFDVDIKFSGRTATAPNDPKSHSCLNANSNNFYYYTQTSGTLKGRDKTAGARIAVTRMGEAFQVGVGANVTNKELSFGASGWLAMTITTQPTTGFNLELQTSSAGGNGDININLDGNATACFGSEITLNCPVDLTTVAQLGANGKVVTWTPPVATTTCMIGNGTTCSPSNLSGFEFLGEFEGSRYYCSAENNHTWLQARDKAIAAGGTLAVVCSQAENDFIKDGLLADYAWIGYSEHISEGNYKWVNGENCTYENWAAGQPNNYGGDEDFTRLLKNGEWTDRNGRHTAEFIMEIPCEGGTNPGNVVTTQVAGPAPGSEFPIGMTEVKYEAIDDCGNMEMCSFIVTVEEPVDPCAGNGSPAVEVETRNPDCGQSNGKIKFTFSDNSGRTNIEFSVDGGQTYPLNVSDNAGMAMFSDLAAGTYNLFVRWGNGECAVDLGSVTLEDARLTAGTQCDDEDATTINDVIAADGCTCGGTPVGAINLVCNDDIAEKLQPGETGVIVTFNEPTASTTCGLDGLNIDQIEGLTSGSVFPIGTTIIKYRVTDACGNMEMCSFDIVIEGTPLMFDLLCADDITVTEAVGDNGVMVTFNEPSIISNCPADGFTVTMTAGLASGSIFPVGTTTVTFQVEDGCDQTDECSFKVTVNPAPTGEITFVCNDDIIVTETVGENDGVTVTYNDPTATTTCSLDGLTVARTAGPASGSIFPIGTTTVTYTAKDACGEEETCSFDVTVNPAPTGEITFACNDDIIVTETVGENDGVAVMYNDPTATTTCSLDGLTVARTAGPASGSIFPIGTTTVTYTAKDACGEEETCSFDVTVNPAPTGEITFVCNDDIIVTETVGENDGVAVTYNDPTATTTCSLDGLTVARTAGPASGSIFPIGTTTVTYTAIDACGEEETCSFDVTVNPAPTGEINLVCNDDIEVTEAVGDSGVVVTYNDPTATSTCPIGAVSVTFISGLASGSIFPVGTTTVIYEATDGCGGVERCAFIVKVNPAPTGEISIICAENQTITIGGNDSTAIVDYDEPVAITSCELDGLNVTLVEGLPSGSAFPIGVSTVVYEATDACGEIERCSLTITVVQFIESCLNDIVIENKVCNDNGTPTDPSDDTYTFDVIVMRTGGAATSYTGFYDNAYLGTALYTADYDEVVTLGPFPAGTFTAPNVFPPLTIEGGLDINLSIVDANDPNCTDRVVVESTGPCSDEIPTGSIGDKVFFDVNQNGIQDPEDTGIAGITVKLLNTADETLETTTTNDLGIYKFEAIEAGDYKVMVNLKDDLRYALANQGDDITEDSDILSDGMTAEFTLLPGANRTDIDAGLVQPIIVEKVKVGDIVFNDANGNGLQDDGEAGIKDVFVQLIDADGEVIAFTTTDDNGMYMFGDLDAGNYQLKFMTGQSDNLIPTLQDEGDNDEKDSDIDENGLTEVFTLTTGFDDSRDAGFKPRIVEPDPATIGNQVFLDANGNSKKEDGEAGIDGVEVKLIAENGAILQTTNTENGGLYSFTVVAGNYRVMFGTPFGFNPTNQSGNATDGIDNDSDIDPTTGMTELFAVAAGAVNTTIDAGFVAKPDPCTADAGTLIIDVDSVELADGLATISATSNGDTVVPTGYEVLYVLTKGAELVIEQTNATPSFTVTSEGKYTIHTLVYETATLDLSIVVLGLTTGFDVNSLLIQGGGDICAALDVAGAMVMVMTPVDPCDNITNGGLIEADEDPEACGPYDAAAIINLESPSGGSGDIEYIWLSSTESCPTELTDMIPGANSQDYDPGVLRETTYFVRCARRVGCDVWIESDCVVKKVDACDNGGPVDCDAVTATVSEGKVTVDGLIGSNAKVEVIGAGTGWIPTLVCGDGGTACENPQMITDLPEGDYTIKIQLWGADGSYCYGERRITVDGGEPTCNVDGGTISTDDDTTDLCVGDNETNIVNFAVTGSNGANSAWVVTDNDGIILNADAPNSIDFEGAGAGTCYVYYLRYENIEGLTAGANIDDLSGCFDKSNRIEVTRTENCGDPTCAVDGGTISTNDDTTDLCVGDNEANVVNFTVTGSNGANSAWVVTDNNGIILNADAPSSIDFEGAGTGTCYVYYLRYENIEGLTAGANIADLSGCFGKSNRIEVTRTDNCGGGEPVCDDVVITTGNGKINLVGLSAPFVVVKIHDVNAGWSIIEQCVGCEDPTTFNVPAGDYNVVVEFYRGFWNDKYCRRDVRVTVTEGDTSCEDKDEDGICQEDDCDDNNPQIGAKQNPGTSCDDSNDLTINDVIQADGCTCAGEEETTPEKEICIERDVFNTENCLDNIVYGLYLKLVGYDEYYAVSDAAFIEYTDGTALYTATAINNTNPSIGWNIEVNFSGRTTLAAVAPKQHNCLTADVNEFYFYETLEGILTGINDAAGASMNITRIGPAFQLGIAANITHNDYDFGGGGWFVANMLTQPTSGLEIMLDEGAQGQNGDININLSGDGTECIDDSSNSELDCGNVTAIATADGITISGLTAPIEIVKVFDASWVPVENCAGDCGESMTVAVAPGNYMVRVNFYTANWIGECEVDIPVTVPASTNVNDAATSRTGTPLTINTEIAPIAVFPNPAKEEVFVNLKNYVGKTANIQVVNTFGQVVQEVAVDKISTQAVRLDVSNFQTGLYHLSIRVENSNIITKKVLVNRQY